MCEFAKIRKCEKSIKKNVLYTLLIRFSNSTKKAALTDKLPTIVFNLYTKNFEFYSK